MMPNSQFRELVKRMRYSQRLFFRSRNPDALDSAKMLEREVDAELRRGETLFDGETREAPCDSKS